MNSSPKNLPASVRQRLQNYAQCQTPDIPEPIYAVKN